ncbi:unnamed protein product [Rotaria magnacalcarata]|uniref:Uncharacterized protein n=1 Tax=Rotaria magnacalcarata TaxID=392030 RepID=A0A819KF18_9BILA|nr:unnamed protein product [Rotaria magnacalcarata]CAF4370002.1 unnamed protein product [Rotaria magnacalcarata]
MSDWSSFKIATFQTYQSTITPFQSSTPLTTTKTPSAASPGQVISTFFNNDTLITRVVYDNTSTTVARFLLYDVFMIYGILLDIITDNGCHFTLSLYKLMLQ